jgi:peptidoglycan/LPS O-acetylase OafA/YrhL
MSFAARSQTGGGVSHQPGLGSSAPSSRPAPASVPSTVRQELHHLTGIRALAALYVWALHITGRGPMLDLYAPATLNGGYGVSLFFALSGFIMSHAYQRCHLQHRDCLKGYALKRFWRIYPAYWIQLLMSWRSVRCLWDGDSNATYLISGRENKVPCFYWGNLKSILCQILGIDTWTVWNILGWTNVGWSVQTEIFFYTVFPWLRRYISGSKGCCAFLLLWLFGTNFCLKFCPYIFPEFDTLLYFTPWSRCSEFALGIWLFKARPQAPTWMTVDRFTAVFACILIISPIMMHPEEVPLKSLRIILPSLFVVWLALAIREHPSTSYFLTFLSRPTIVYAGKASYIAYLFQFPLWIEGLQEAWMGLCALVGFSCMMQEWVVEPLYEWGVRDIPRNCSCQEPNQSRWLSTGAVFLSPESSSTLPPTNSSCSSPSTLSSEDPESVPLTSLNQCPSDSDDV